MVADIFDFWSQIGRTETVHPADCDVFNRLGGHGFNHKTLPACFTGPLRTAPVVLLYMSPGLSTQDEKVAGTPEGQDYYVRRRGGSEPLPNAETPGGKWWIERTKCFDLPQATIASQVAILNIGAYHSKQMNDPELLAALPSSRVCLDWAQEVLFPEAESGRRVVVCLRAAKFWGLSPKKTYSGTLFAPSVTRGGHMIKGVDRDTVVSAVRAAISKNQAISC